MLIKKKTEYYKKLLQNQLTALLEGDKNSLSTLPELKEESPDFVDQASAESHRDFTLHIKERESKLILKIKEALERLEVGTFGICESCGEKISEKRLQARPITTLCVDCKRKQEAGEKLRGL